MNESRRTPQESAIRTEGSQPAPVPAVQGNPEDLGTDIPQLKKGNASSEKDERADNLGCGLALIIVGGGMLAQNLGWLPKGDWLWPGALIGLGAGYLYKAFRKS
jgi:hypothetical protein